MEILNKLIKMIKPHYKITKTKIKMKTENRKIKGNLLDQ